MADKVDFVNRVIRNQSCILIFFEYGLIAGQIYLAATLLLIYLARCSCFPSSSIVSYVMSVMLEERASGMSIYIGIYSYG